MFGACAGEEPGAEGAALREPEPLAVGDAQRDRLCGRGRADQIVDRFCVDPPSSVGSLMELQRVAAAAGVMYVHHMSTMVRKQVYLTAELDERLRREAARQQRSEADILREALAAQLNVADPRQLDASEDSLWSLVGIAASDDTDLSERVDEVLYGVPARRR